MDDLDIDPWGDYNNLPSILPTTTPASSSAAETGEGEDLYTLDPDTDIMPFSVVQGDQKFSIALDGFSPTGIDYDGDEFSLDRLTLAYAPVDKRDYTNVYSMVGNPSTKGGTMYSEMGWRGLKVEGKGNPEIPISSYAQYMGRPDIVNGDVDISVRSKIGASSGFVRIRLDSFEPTEGVESITFNDFVFGYFPWYTYYTDTGFVNDYGRDVSSNAAFKGAYLYINGEEHSRLLTSSSGAANFRPDSNSSSFRCEIQNQTVQFEGKPYIETVEIVLAFTIPAYNSYVMTNGGWSVMVGGAKNKAASYGAYSGATFAVQADASSANNGLLKSIIEFLQNIINGITNMAQQIARLPGLIADEIMGRIRSLFVPTEEDLTQLKADYQSMLETKFGFIYQCFQLLENFFTALVDGWGSASDYSFNFPGVSFEIQGVTYTLIAPQPISLDNALMDVLRPVAGTVVSFICVLAFVHSMETMFIGIISGKNYFDYVNSAYNMMADEGLLEEDEIV